MASSAAVPEHVKPVREKVLHFIEQCVYPLEHRLRCGKISDAEAAAATRELQQAAKAEGLWALGHPIEIGGQGMPFKEYIHVNEVQGRSELGSICLGTHSLQDSLMLHKYASDHLKQQYLPDLVAANIYPSFAMTEPAITSSDPTGIQTTAQLEGDQWVINGRKWWTSGAAIAAFTSVMVRTEFGGDTPKHLCFSIILVPTETVGYRIQRSTRVLGTDGIDHSEVVYDNVRVPFANLMGKRGAGFIIAQERLGPGRIFHCMRWLGQAQRAFDLMCYRLQQRRLQGAALGESQLMQQHVFDSFADIQCMRLLTLSAAEKMDSGASARIELATAKGWGAPALNRVVDRAVQVWGAKGLTDDTPLGSMYRHARAARFYDGPDEVHVTTVGRLIGVLYARGNSWDFSSGVPRPSGAAAAAEDDAEKHTSRL